jgi:hypothetical protein
MSEMPHCLSHVPERKMMPITFFQLRIKEINAFLRILVPKVAESRVHIRGLNQLRKFRPATELKMLGSVVDCTIEVLKCIQ